MASRVEFTGYENIIDSLFTFDPDQAVKQVTECLQFSKQASRTEYGELVDALDQAEENARVALQLVANSEVALVNYKNDMETIRAGIREKAVEEMMDDSDDGDEDTEGAKKKPPKPKKRPTIADIDAYMRSTYHDELNDADDRLAKGKQMVEYFRGLATLTAQRARDLRQMVASCRGV